MKLLLDAMCGGIAAHLRMCGHDVAYALDRGVEDDDAIADLARREGRTLVTRDRELAGRLDDAITVHAKDAPGQLAELAEAGVPLELEGEPSRCGRCNGPLSPVDAGASTPEYAPVPGDVDVWRCEDCGQYFWKGSHWDRVEETLAGLNGSERS